MDYLIDHVLIRRVGLKCDERPDRKCPDGIGNRERPLSAVFPARERKDVRSALALTIDIKPAHLVDKRVYQGSNLPGIFTEYADLLPVS